MKNLTIGFGGNFIPPFSTENDRKWSFEKLGHKVISFQENDTTPEELQIAMPKLDMLLYSHTHDPAYVIPDLIKVFKEYKKAGVPTVSVHLDRWAWLKREEDMGQEATWFTEYIFMADASPEAAKIYDRLKLNWFYLKPGVVERDCVMEAPDPAVYPHEIVFIGSKGYHPEYPFRPRLIDFLHETYGDRFGHYGNDGLGVVRGQDLNQLLVTAKVVVGDSCFGGRPRYVSDRYYETRGRGGFLIHPLVEGVDKEGIGTYGGYAHDKENLESLRKAIDYYLRNDNLRENLRLRGFTHVKEHETYTHRAQEMLEVIYG
jgi:hypothetical protein